MSFPWVHSILGHCQHGWDPCCLDMPGEMTVEHVGARSVPLRTMEHEKSHFTVVLVSMADRQKIKPFVVLRVFIPFLSSPAFQELLMRTFKMAGWTNSSWQTGWYVFGAHSAFTREFLCVGWVQMPHYGQCQVHHQASDQQWAQYHPCWPHKATSTSWHLEE